MNPTTHRFQPMLDMDDRWFIVDTDTSQRSWETFPRDASVLLCWGLEDQPSRVAEFAWGAWPDD